MSELQDRLRDAFETQLQHVSPEREARLRAFDYRSQRGRGRLWAALAASGTALVAAIVAVILLLFSGASPAYAGWSPVPTVPTPAALSAATAACNRLHSRTGPPILTGKPVLTDTRGKYTAAIYASGRVTHICISDGQHSGGTSLSMNRRFRDGPARPSADQLSSPIGDGAGAPGFPSATNSPRHGYVAYTSGLAGRDVTAVTFNFKDGSSVNATVQNGRYFAWWPDANQPITVKLTTNSGTLTSPMFAPACANPSKCVFATR